MIQHPSSKYSPTIQKTYRSDIDGLRAIAVLGVVFFHVGASLFSGGYMGVDVFFVISGYLITGIILRKSEAGEYSLLYFYDRRIRRLFPALFAVVSLTTLTAVVIFHPTHLYDFAQSLVANGFFASNFLFYFESGYFAAPSETKPLLHTWSLAVEEQFYLLFPILLLSVLHLGREVTKNTLIAALIVSIAMCSYSSYTSPQAAFYLPYFRAWEFLLGSVIAIDVFPETRSYLFAESLSILGLTFIAVSLLFFDSSSAFPIYAGIFPTLGAALLIYAGSSHRTTISRLLSLKPLVFIGLISYSLYLWHWPILVFTRYLSINTIEIPHVVIVLVLSLIVSTLSWKYIEMPLRTRSYAQGTKPIFISGFLMILTFLTAGGLLLASNGLESRYSFYDASITTQDLQEWRRWGQCQDVLSKLNSGQELCSIGWEQDTRMTFLLWGDSHARALAPGIDAAAISTMTTGRIATRPACPPLLGVSRPDDTGCMAFNDQVLSYVSRNSEIDTIFLSARWALLTEGTRYKQEVGDEVELVVLGESHEKDSIQIFREGIERTIAELSALNKKVVIIKQVPEIGFDVPSAIYVASLTRRDASEMISPTRSEYLDRNRNVSKVFEGIAISDAVRLVDPSELLCDSEHCSVSRDSVPLYRDDDHLSYFGARLLAPAIVEYLE